jgi:hypothetical protein
MQIYLPHNLFLDGIGIYPSLILSLPALNDLERIDGSFPSFVLFSLTPLFSYFFQNFAFFLQGELLMLSVFLTSIPSHKTTQFLKTACWAKPSGQAAQVE